MTVSRPPLSSPRPFAPWLPLKIVPSSTSCGLLLKTRSSWTRALLKTGSSSPLTLKRPPVRLGATGGRIRWLPIQHFSSRPFGTLRVQVQLDRVFSVSKSNRTQKEDGGCKRRLFSAETPSPTGGQKQRVANSCGFGVHPLLIPYDWRRSAQRVERADGFVAARALAAMLVVILWPAQLPCDAQRNYRYTYLV